MNIFRVAIVSLVTGLFLALPHSVAAETQECSTSTGSYGKTSITCKVLGETVTVTHQPVSAGVEFSFWTIAQVLAIVSIACFGVAKLAERVYWLD